MRTPCAVLLASVLFPAPGAAAGIEAPEPLSPGDGLREGRVVTVCPTFSWTEAPGAKGYRVLVYRAGDAIDRDALASSPPAIAATLPARAYSWTPSAETCLEPAGRYAWVVGAQGDGERTAWSQPALFRVTPSDLPAARPAPAPPPRRAPRLAGPPARALAPGAAAPARSIKAPALRRRVAAPYVAEQCNGTFTDVPLGHPYCAWIERLALDEIAGPCGSGLFCPDHPVTRGQLAMFLERSMRGTNTWRPELGDGASANLPAAAAQAGYFAAIGDTADHGALTLASDGLPLVSYTAGGELRVVHCHDDFCSTFASTTLDAPAGQSAIALSAAGLGVVAYGDNSDLRIAFCVDADCNSASLPTVDSGGFHPSMVLGSDGQPLIAHVDNGRLKVAHCTDPTCSIPDNTYLDESPGVDVTATSIALGADGLGLVAYHDANDDELRVAHCQNVACTSAIISSVVFSGDQPSITVGVDGLGLISYLRRTGVSTGDLWVAHCNNTACTSNTPFFVDTTGALTGTRSSITLGADGLGVVSYRSEDTGALQVAHCSTVDCSSSLYRTVLPTATFAAGYTIGDWTAITLGNNGLPIVATYAITVPSTDNAPLLLFCPNTFCADYFRRR